VRINLYTVIAVGIGILIVGGVSLFAVPFARGTAGAATFLFAAPTATPLPTATPTTTPEPTATIQPQATARPVIDADLRTGPGSAFDLVGPAAARRPLVLVGCNEDCSWFQTDTGAWIAGVLLDRPPARLPIMTPDPARAALASALIPTLTPTPVEFSLALPTPTPALAEGEAPATAGATVLENANLRGGPGTEYPSVGSAQAGATVVLVAKNGDGTWYQLEGGAWIASFLVENVPAELPVVVDIPAVPAIQLPAAPDVPAALAVEPTAAPETAPEAEPEGA
jgi:uncharacterized protein YraI